MNYVRRFPHTTDSVTQARSFVLDAVAELPNETRDDIAVMLSELATNAFRHGESSYVVRVDVTPERVRVEVTDTGEGEPTVRSPGPTEPTGRGLRIVESLSDDWGVSHAHGEPGKTVWFRLGIVDGARARLRETL